MRDLGSMIAETASAIDQNGVIEATVAVSIGQKRRSSFACPKCSRQIIFHNAFPLDFQWKVCPGCRRLWSNARYWNPSYIHADDHAGTVLPLAVSAIDRSVDDERGVTSNTSATGCESPSTADGAPGLGGPRPGATTSRSDA